MLLPTILTISILSYGVRCQVTDTLQVLSIEKETLQSSTDDVNEGNYTTIGDSLRAVDPFGGLTCSRTQKANITWWMVDLGDVFLISQVAIQTPSGISILRNFTIDVSVYWNETSSDLVNPVECYYGRKALPRGGRSLLLCSSNIMGRYVQVTKRRIDDPKAISLCHVEVFGTTTRRAYMVEIQPRRRSTYGLIQTVPAGSYLQCFTKCSQFIGCSSFNMEDGSDVCELISDAHDLHSQAVDADGWMRCIINNTT